MVHVEGDLLPGRVRVWKGEEVEEDSPLMTWSGRSGKNWGQPPLPNPVVTLEDGIGRNLSQDKTLETRLEVDKGVVLVILCFSLGGGPCVTQGLSGSPFVDDDPPDL